MTEGPLVQGRKELDDLLDSGQINEQEYIKRYSKLLADYCDARGITVEDILKAAQRLTDDG